MKKYVDRIWDFASNGDVKGMIWKSPAVFLLLIPYKWNISIPLDLDPFNKYNILVYISFPKHPYFVYKTSLYLWQTKKNTVK